MAAFLLDRARYRSKVELLNEFGQWKGATSSPVAFACLLAQKPSLDRNSTQNRQNDFN
jgi:hypothetical protein